MNARTAHELSPRILLAAYSEGFFPMGEGERIHWYCPDPRGVINLAAYRPSRSLRQIIRKSQIIVSVNKDFRGVIHGCSDRQETWITDDIIKAYVKLHELGYAHSVEAWDEGILAGGLYGVALGGAFFGESMFNRKKDASKITFNYLIERLKERGFVLLDTQFLNPHLILLGGMEIPRQEYLSILKNAIRLKCSFG